MSEPTLLELAKFVEADWKPGMSEAILRLAEQIPAYVAIHETQTKSLEIVRATLEASEWRLAVTTKRIERIDLVKIQRVIDLLVSTERPGLADDLRKAIGQA